jgi:hypothetical protein
MKDDILLQTVLGSVGYLLVIVIIGIALFFLGKIVIKKIGGKGKKVEEEENTDAAGALHIFKKMAEEGIEEMEIVSHLCKTKGRAAKKLNQINESLEAVLAKNVKLEGKMKYLPRRKGLLEKNKYAILVSVFGIFSIIVCVIGIIKN